MVKKREKGEFHPVGRKENERELDPKTKVIKSQKLFLFPSIKKQTHLHFHSIHSKSFPIFPIPPHPPPEPLHGG